MTKFVKAAFHKDVRTVEFIASNGDRMLRSGGTLAWLFNNPGNLRPKSKSLYPGQIGTGDTKYGKLCIFSSVEAGRAEKRALLRRKYNPMTLRKAIFTYAPPTDNNDSEAYLAFVKKKTGLADGMVIEDLLETQLDALMSAMEQYEGFNAQKETRKEKWVHIAQVTLSDGARPIPGEPVKVVRGETTEHVRTDAFGRLPPFVTTRPGELLSLQLGQNTGLQCTVDLTLRNQSQSLVLFRSGMEYKSAFSSHNPVPGSKPRKPDPIRYVIQPRDSLQDIAKRFRVDPRKLASDNKSMVPNPDRIFPGQVIWIHGEAETVRMANGASMRGSIQASPAQHATRAARSNDNQGHPLGVVRLDQKRARWMEFAVSEAERWAGKLESAIDDSINYHNELGTKTKFPSMSGTNNAWCASFVNWCLRSAGYRISSPHPYRARSFIGDANFSEIETPIYGAIAVIGTHHACFVYAQDEVTGRVIMLGGNQSDQINFSEFPSETRYFVPKAYEPYARSEVKNPMLAKTSRKRLNETMGIRVKAGRNGTR